LDQGQQFLSKVLKEVNKYLHVKKHNAMAYHPQTDGLVKQFNRMLEGMLAKFTNKQQDDWDIYVPHVLLAYHTNTHEATGDSPLYLLYGCKAKVLADLNRGPRPLLIRCLISLTNTPQSHKPYQPPTRKPSCPHIGVPAGAALKPASQRCGVWGCERCVGCERGVACRAGAGSLCCASNEISG
jgi:hypothetical protein